MKRVRKNDVPDVVIQLGTRIKTVIENKGLKKREVAYDAGMDVENLRKYMKGTQHMKISTLVRIAEALGMSASELIENLPVKQEE